MPSTTLASGRSSRGAAAAQRGGRRTIVGLWAAGVLLFPCARERQLVAGAKSFVTSNLRASRQLFIKH
eukprot:9527241-Alexandrium_andersonii.AAC.1